MYLPPALYRAEWISQLLATKIFLPNNFEKTILKFNDSGTEPATFDDAGTEPATRLAGASAKLMG